MIMSPEDQMFMMRAVAGAVLGICLGILKLPEYWATAGIALSIMGYVCTYVVGRALFLSQGAIVKSKLLTSGAGTYFAMFLFFWALLHTLMRYPL